MNLDSSAVHFPIFLLVLLNSPCLVLLVLLKFAAHPLILLITHEPPLLR